MLRLSEEGVDAVRGSRSSSGNTVTATTGLFEPARAIRFAQDFFKA
jgi:hypothetical protein